MKIVKRYNKNLKARIDKELYIYNIEQNHNNAKFYGLVERNNNIFTIYTENLGNIIIYNVVTWIPVVKRNKNDNGYEIEYKRISRSTGEDKLTLTDSKMKETIKSLITHIEQRIEEEKN